MLCIFMDIDGVLVTDKAKWGTPDWDCKCQAQLVHLLRNTGAKIVLSSSWRQTPALFFHFMFMLQCLGFPPETVIGTTPVIGLFQRGKEVEEFLNSRAQARMMLDPAGDWIKRWVIIDDAPEFYLTNPICEGHMVDVDPIYGLTEANRLLAEAILNKE